jgi:membrane-associated phospholipid phosphatase
MDAIFDLGIRIIIMIQSWGDWLTAPMKFFTFLGSENFFLLVLPALYWCIDMNLGIRIGFILLVNASLNETLKLAFHGPRPYWYSTKVKAFIAESSFGVPSGHSQNSVGVWGMLASHIERNWAWVAAVLVMFLIGLSRLYLAVHFPQDVLLGWGIGALVLWLFIHYWERVEGWLEKLQLNEQIMFAFGISIGLIALSGIMLILWINWILPVVWIQNATAAFPNEPFNSETLSPTISSAATLFGLAAGLAWLKSRGGYDVYGSVWLRSVRYVLGIAGMLAIYLGLKTIFPDGETFVAYIFQYIRYALIGVWVSALAPMLFIRFNLARGES